MLFVCTLSQSHGAGLVRNYSIVHGGKLKLKSIKAPWSPAGRWYNKN